MGINAVTTTAFIGQVAASMTSFGVSSTGGPTGDLTYVVALMGQFNRYTSMTPPDASICYTATCPLATGFAEFDTSSAGVFSIIPSTMTGTAVSINVGDSVHWNLGTTDGVTQTDTAAGTTPTSSGIVSGTGIRSYTYTFTTAGTYYFYNAGTPASKCSVIVAGMMGSSTAGSMMGSTASMMGSTASMMGSTASMMGSSATGGASAVAGVSGLAVAAAAAVALSFA